MNVWAGVLMVGAGVLVGAGALAEGPTTPRGTFVAGAGWSGSTTEADVPRDDSDSFTADGWGLTFRAGLGKRWGVALTYRQVEDDESFSSGERIEAGLIGGHAAFTWLETAHTQWYAKVGVTWATFESDLPGVGATPDGALGPSIGLGFDWGARRLAFFIDWEVTLVDVEIRPGRPESLVTGATLVGLVTRF